MKWLNLVGFVLMISFLSPVQAEDLQATFVDACKSSPRVDETSNCNCVYNEVIHRFGADDAKELIPFVTGEEELGKEAQDSFNFIVGKCEA